MTRKHFQLIADFIVSARNISATREQDDEQRAAAQRGIDTVVKELAYALRSTNPHFDADRFTAACAN